MGLRDIFRKTTDSKEVGEAATTKNTNVIADEASDNMPFGLDVWVEGVDPIVEYISLEAFYSLIAANSCPGLQYRRNTRPEWSSRKDLDGGEQSELAARCEHAINYYTEC
jgi:hypothetical protein